MGEYLQGLKEFLESEPLLESSRHNVDDGRGESLLVHVYDMIHQNAFFHSVGIGVYHTGVELYGKEYTYGYSEDPGTGVYRAPPFSATEWATYRMTIDMGPLLWNKDEAKLKIRQMCARFQGNEYDILHQNCNHFTIALCLELAGKPPPLWINRLAFLGSKIECCLPARLKMIHIAPEEEVQHEHGALDSDCPTPHPS